MPNKKIHISKSVLMWLETCCRALRFKSGQGERPDPMLAEKYRCIQQAYRGDILDLGAGPCRFTHFLRERGHSVCPVDVVDASEVAGITPVLYDAHRLPFTSGAFETSLCMFVLHHCARPDEVLTELRRVTRGAIIVAEDLLETRFDRLLTLGHEWSSCWGDSSAYHSFKSDAEWRALFASQGLRVQVVVHVQRSKIPYYPIRRAIYVLERDAERGAFSRREGGSGAAGRRGPSGESAMTRQKVP
ncbi:MAG: class I SAM-dependent methyltransferase [bacterium]